MEIVKSQTQMSANCSFKKCQTAMHPTVYNFTWQTTKTVHLQKTENGEKFAISNLFSRSNTHPWKRIIYLFLVSYLGHWYLGNRHCFCLCSQSTRSTSFLESLIHAFPTVSPANTMWEAFMSGISWLWNKHGFLQTQSESAWHWNQLQFTQNNHTNSVFRWFLPE